MKAVQVLLDEGLLEQLDASDEVRQQGRSAVVRRATEAYLRKHVPLARSKTVRITSLAPEPYTLLQPIEVVLEPDPDGYLATFYDANVCTSGDTDQEAFENLKALLLDLYDSLEREAPERLGPEPARQLAVLRSFLRAG